MENYLVKSLAGLFLAWNGYLDWKKREISLVSLLVFGTAGAGINLLFSYQTFWEVLGGIGIGALMLAAAFLTKEAIGFGDGLLLGVCGIILGFWETLDLIVSGTFLCAAVMGTGLLLGKVKREDTIPLVPFLFAAYVGRMIV